VRQIGERLMSGTTLMERVNDVLHSQPGHQGTNHFDTQS
jgi:hypothetical protein